jgi:hypothetical protein
LSRSVGLPFADRLQCRLRATLLLSITDPDTFTDIVFSGNSAFDPFGALGSVQPTYYDQLAALYGNVVVRASKVMFNIVEPQVAVPGRFFRCGIAPRDASSAFSTASDLLSQARAVHKDVSTAGPPTVVANSARTTQILGLKDVFQTQALSTACVSCVHPTDANPSSEWFWHVTAVTSVVGTDISVGVDVQIEYECEFFDRQPQALSLLDRLVELKTRREQYLKLKALTPNKSGRLPRPAPHQALREYVDDSFVRIPEAPERKEPAKPLATKRL